MTPFYEGTEKVFSNKLINKRSRNLRIPTPFLVYLAVIIRFFLDVSTATNDTIQ